jgi:hypothetical protein
MALTGGTPPWFDSFASAFRDRVASCRATCACGREFFDPDGSWDFEDGEIEKLDAVKATRLTYAPGYLTILDTVYVDACDCWHKIAIRVGAFLLEDIEKVGAFYRAERERRRADVDRLKAVESETSAC